MFPTTRRTGIALVLAALSIGAVVIPSVLAQTSVETEVTGESFDSAASAARSGWTARGNATGGSDFGWRATNATGRTPGGEAGGVLTDNGAAGWYADVTIGGAMTLDDRIASTGELDVLGQGGDTGEVAHFRLPSTVDIAADLPRVGFAVNGDAADPMLIPVLVRDDGVRRVAPEGVSIEPDGDYRFRSVYEPDAGEHGVLELTVFAGADDEIGRASLSLTAEDRLVGATLNAFGLLAGASQGTEPVVMVIDQVVYSVGGPLIATL